MNYKDEYKNRIYSDLNNLILQTREIIEWGNSKIAYSDYYDSYKDITEYLTRINFPNTKTNKIITHYPKLIKPSILTYNNCPIWIIPIGGIINLYIFLIVLTIVAPIVIPLIIARLIMVRKIKNRTRNILTITNKLMYGSDTMI
jgi:hypothetical protein